MTRIAVLGGRGKTERAVSAALADRGALAVPLGRADWADLAGAYLQNLDLTGPVRVPYDVHATFGLLDLEDLGAAAATVLLDDSHVGATYELASRVATVAGLAAEAGVTAERVDDPGTHPWLSAMFVYYDRHGLPVGTLPLRALLGRA